MAEAVPGRDIIRGLLDPASIGRRARVEGWVRTRRTGKGFTFLEVNDGSSIYRSHTPLSSSAQ